MDLTSLESTVENVPEIFSVMEMTSEEAAASLKAKPHHNQPPIQKIRSKHHQVAKLIAAGFKDADIARKVGYAAGTVNTLKSNPAIRELIEHYSGEYQETVGELHERMEALTIDLLEEIEARMEDDTQRKDISLSELKELLKDMLDRTGRGPIKRIEERSVRETLHGGIIRHVREVAAEKRFDSGGARPDQEKLASGRTLSKSRGLGMGELPRRQPLGQGAEAERVSGEGAGIRAEVRQVSSPRCLPDYGQV